MAKRSFGNVNWTPTAFADTAAITGPFQALKGGSATQRLHIQEIYLGGLAVASAPTLMMLALASTLGITPTALAAPAFDGPMDGATAALAAPAVSYTAAATGPQRSAVTTSPRVNLAYNAFGGIVRWVAAPYEDWVQTGASAAIGESVLSAFTGGTPGAQSSHIIYEPL